MRYAPRAPRAALAALLAAGALACAPAGEAPAGAVAEDGAPAAAAAPAADGGLRPLDPPAAPGAMAPNLAADGGDLLMTWLEPLEPVPPGPDRAKAHALRFARLSGERWSQPATIASGTDFFANWADFPSVAAGRDGLVAHWLGKIGDDTYAYGIRLARSTDRGATWRETGFLHDDRSPTEHGFVSFVAEPGGLRAFWLDGRQMEAGGPMGLRTARLGAGAAGPSEVLDARVCDCCQTDAAMADGGPVVVYRDRSEEEVRDISVVRWTAGGWSAPAAVHDDGWRIPGCPVNGPAIAAAGKRVVVAWFTAAPATVSAAPGARPEGAPRVRAAFSQDGGATFTAPIEIDGGKPLGRVDVALTPAGEAVVSWLAIDTTRPGGAGAVVRLRRVSPRGAGAPHSVAATGATRSSGFPRMALQADRLVLAWVEEGEPGRLRAAALPLAALPPPPGGAS